MVGRHDRCHPAICLFQPAEIKFYRLCKTLPLSRIWESKKKKMESAIGSGRENNDNNNNKKDVNKKNKHTHTRIILKNKHTHTKKSLDIYLLAVKLDWVSAAIRPDRRTAGNVRHPFNLTDGHFHLFQNSILRIRQHEKSLRERLAA